MKKGWRVRKGRRVNEKARGGRREQWREEEEGQRETVINGFELIILSRSFDHA